MVDLTKPARGSRKRELREKRRAARANERYEKDKVREREDLRGPCRWPHYTSDEKRDCFRAAKHVAHLDHKKMGGDTLTLRSRRHKMLQVCRDVHRLIDTGLAKVEFLDGARAGTDGRLAFFERATHDAPWVEVGREVSRGVLARRAS